jgi:cbb3-type cytochrome oxidase subunit 3
VDITELIKGLGLSYGVPLLLILLVALYVWRPKAKRRYEEDARIPFQEKEEDEEG